MPHALPRRTFLRAAGVGLALPLLDAMRPTFARASAPPPRRLVAVQTNMGILPQHFFPTAAGPDYELTPYLKLLARHRDRLTVFSGLSHPDVDGGHAAEKCFLTAAPHPGGPAFRNTVAIDQLAAEAIGPATRFPSLVLAASHEHPTLSFTRGGVGLPAERSATKLYRQLFAADAPAAVAARAADLDRGRSLLDFVADGAKDLRRGVGRRDRERLDQYFTSVRELEQRLARQAAWERKPKPAAPAPPPPPDVADPQRFADQARLLLDVAKLALETDSTRVVSFFLDATAIHAATHHGNRPETLAELRAIEESQFRVLDHFLAGLAGVREDGDLLLDRTAVVYGTCMGNANAHSNYNLPVLLAGGGFRHGRHLAFDTRPGKNHPLANLFLSVLHRLGVPADRFASSTGTLRGLEANG